MIDCVCYRLFVAQEREHQEEINTWLHSWLIFLQLPKNFVKKNIYFGTRPGVVHSGSGVLFSFWFAMMSPWENSRWQLNRCPIGLQTGCAALNNSSGFAKLLKKRAKIALLGPPSPLQCHLGVTLRRLSGRRYADGARAAHLVVSLVPKTHSGLLSFQRSPPHPRPSVWVNAHKVAFCWESDKSVLQRLFSAFFFF